MFSIFRLLGTFKLVVLLIYLNVIDWAPKSILKNIPGDYTLGQILARAKTPIIKLNDINGLESIKFLNKLNPDFIFSVNAS